MQKKMEDLMSVVTIIFYLLMNSETGGFCASTLCTICTISSYWFPKKLGLKYNFAGGSTIE